MLTALEALDRTALLINGDFFDDTASAEAIVAGLLGTTVRIEADRENLSSHSGQTLLVTLASQLAMMGMGVELAIPADIPLTEPQLPVQGTDLLSGLVAYAHDLIPGLRIGQAMGPTDLTFLIGDTRAEHESALRISGDEWTCRVEPAATSTGSRWRASWPLGALAGAGAAAPEALRVALQRIADSETLTLAPTYRYSTNRPVALDLSFPGCRPATLDMGRLDWISGGAITTAALYALLRFLCTGEIRVIESDTVEISNLNRYPLMRRSHCGSLKAEVLASYGRPGLTISAVPERFTSQTARTIGPLAPRVFVGVDHIPSRWVVQRAYPDWLCVGSTSHLFSLVSIHQPGDPCAGCLHPRDDDAPGLIPTISFVSFWAGLLQVRYLIASLHGYSAPQSLYCWPFGLDGRRAISPVGVPRTTRCPVQCPASLLRHFDQTA